MTKKRVIIFKKQDTLDPYNQAFLDNDYIPIFIPVLDHQTTNINEIASTLLDPSALTGLILTSQRSVQALQQAHELVKDSISFETQQKWKQLPCYIVGSQTAHALLHLPLYSQQTTDEFPTHWIVAPRAAELIGPLLNAQTHRGHLLFLAGDKRRDLIPTQLDQSRVSYREIQTYFTCAHPFISDNLKQQTTIDWVVFFSPSGLKFLLSSVDTHCKQKLLASEVAAIGPTTAEAIQSDLHKNPTVVAENPDANHLVDAIVHFDK